LVSKNEQSGARIETLYYAVGHTALLIFIMLDTE
jgi:hypothetical protein